MNEFDYGGSAELFLRNIGLRGKNLNYKRFGTAAEAIQFAVEAAGGFASTTLEVDGGRYEKADIQRLYDASEYPLERKPALAA
jgi:hypothetical protein